MVNRQAVVLELDGGTGALIGAPRWLGRMEPTSLAVDGKRIVVVRRLAKPATIMRKQVTPAGDVDATDCSKAGSRAAGEVPYDSDQGYFRYLVQRIDMSPETTRIPAAGAPAGAAPNASALALP